MFLRRSLASLAHAYKLQLVMSVHLGGLPPTPHTKKLTTLLPIPTEVITFFSFSFFSLVSFLPENEDPFEVRTFLAGGGGGGGVVSSKF